MEENTVREGAFVSWLKGKKSAMRILKLQLWLRILEIQPTWNVIKMSHTYANVNAIFFFHYFLIKRSCRRNTMSINLFVLANVQFGYSKTQRRSSCLCNSFFFLSRKQHQIFIKEDKTGSESSIVKVKDFIKMQQENYYFTSVKYKVNITTQTTSWRANR